MDRAICPRSPKSQAMADQDEEKHLGPQYHRISVEFFREVLTKRNQSSNFLDRKVVYRNLIKSYGASFRYRVMNWLLYIVMTFKISDEALLHGVKLAENALTTFMLTKENKMTPQSKYMFNKPQYCYVVTLFICTKTHDLTYPNLNLFLDHCQKASNLLKSDSDENETCFFQACLLNFADFEIEILKATQGKISFVPEPNGDQ